MGHEHCGIDCPLDVYKAKNKGRKNYALCPAVHAEINCILTAAMIGTAIEGAVLYITKRPCQDCLKALKNLHLSAVVFLEDDDETHGFLLGPYLQKEIKLYA
jgi:deoxycytidylate deaminase